MFREGLYSTMVAINQVWSALRPLENVKQEELLLTGVFGGISLRLKLSCHSGYGIFVCIIK